MANGIADYDVLMVSDLYVIIADRKSPEKPSVTNSAHDVVADLHEKLGGLGARRVFYRDSVDRFDELRQSSGKFIGFAPVGSSQQYFFQSLFSDERQQPLSV